jgi:hypothetical protein
VQQKIHRYSAQLKGSAVFTIVKDTGEIYEQA